MYLKFFGLKKEPFHITPDPEFLFLSPSHKEALGAIIYGIEKRKGFVSIVGEVGTGKTTIVRSYLERSDREKVKTIYVFSPDISFEQLLQIVLNGLDVEPAGSGSLGLIQQLQQVLIDGYTRDLNIVLIIDEAQNMSVGSLEKLRMLSNLETGKDKLLQIVLVGQPELEKKLSFKDLRQLRQRLAIRATIKPLTSKESVEYVSHRLKLAGQQVYDIFSKRALSRIVKYSDGIPRVLNVLCDNAMIAAFGYQKKPISAKIVKSVISDYEGRDSFLRKSRKFLPVSLMVSMTLFFGIYFLMISRNGAVEIDALASVDYINENLNFKAFRGLQPEKTNNRSDIESFKNKNEQFVDKSPGYSDAISMHPESPDDEFEKQEVKDEVKIKDENSFLDNSEENKKAEVHSSASTAVPVLDKADGLGREIEVFKDSDYYGVFAKSKSEGNYLNHRDGSKFPVFRVVKRGDYLTKLCVDVYGVTSEKIVEWVWANNPWISDSNLLFVGDVVVFPDPYGKMEVLLK